MTLERFMFLLAAYGGDFARWPEGEREGGRELAAALPSAAAARADALGLDRLLARVEPAVDEARARRRAEALVRSVEAGAARRRAAFAGLGPAVPALLLVAALVGVAMGLVEPEPSAASPGAGLDVAQLLLDAGPLETNGL